MTVTYSADVATESFAVFWKILIRWKGTVYKILWKEFLIFVVAYLSINMMYRFGIKYNETGKRRFESAVFTCQQIADGIPIAFILGFYITIVVNRFWDRFDTLPWPDTLGFCVSSFIMGQDERGRVLRRTIIRYINVSYIMLMRQLATSAKKRFPTLQHLVDSGVLLPGEREAYDAIKCPYPKWWVPLAWCNTIVAMCKKEGRIKDDYSAIKLVMEISAYNTACRRTFDYDWVCIPLVYTQVVIIAVYSYFLTNLVAKQFVDLDSRRGMIVHSTATDTEFSWLSSTFFLFQFLFYMGWLKIAATIFNPFGEDDDDFEINYLIDRNLRVGYVIVDEMHNEHPELIKDSFWDQKDIKLPYTSAAADSEKEAPKGSAADVVILPEHSQFLPLAPIAEESLDMENFLNDTAVPIENGSKLQLGASRRSFISKPLPISTHRKKSGGGFGLNSVMGSISSFGSVKDIMGGGGTRPSVLKKLGSSILSKVYESHKHQRSGNIIRTTNSSLINSKNDNMNEGNSLMAGVEDATDMRDTLNITPTQKNIDAVVGINDKSNTTIPQKILGEDKLEKGEPSSAMSSSMYANDRSGTTEDIFPFSLHDLPETLDREMRDQNNLETLTKSKRKVSEDFSENSL